MIYHARYNTVFYPRLVWARKDAPWNIYADARGNCAAIPTKPGYEASHFGNLVYVRDLKWIDALRRNPRLIDIPATRKHLVRWIGRVKP